MSTKTYKEQEREYLTKYYKTLVGLTITDIAVLPDLDDDGNGNPWGDNWLVIQAVDRKGNSYRLEVSQDPEGNGPGFIFGLPNPNN